LKCPYLRPTWETPYVALPLLISLDLDPPEVKVVAVVMQFLSLSLIFTGNAGKEKLSDENVAKRPPLHETIQTDKRTSVVLFVPQNAEGNRILLSP